MIGEILTLTDIINYINGTYLHNTFYFKNVQLHKFDFKLLDKFTQIVHLPIIIGVRYISRCNNFSQIQKRFVENAYI